MKRIMEVLLEVIVEEEVNTGKCCAVSLFIFIDMGHIYRLTTREKYYKTRGFVVALQHNINVE